MLGISYLVILVLAFVLLIPIIAYADVQVSGTTISGSSDESIVKISISNSDGQKVWEKSVSVDETFEITMPRLEDGRYTLSMKHGAIGGEQEIVEFTYTGPAPIGEFEISIELPDSPAQDFDSFATMNRINNFERLMEVIRDSAEIERRLEIIIFELEEERSVSGQDVNAVTRFTPDGLETLEYGIVWTTFRAYNDIIGDGKQILELTRDGMSLDTAIDFLGIIPTPEPEPTPDPTPEPTPEEVVVEITTGTAEPGEMLSIDVTFTTISGESAEHVNYDIKATQDGEIVLNDMGIHDHDGVMNHMTSTLSNTALVEIEVIFNGFGIDPPFTGPIGQISINHVELELTPEPIPEPEELGIASFVDKSKDPQSYIDRYNSEPSYKKWFDDNYSEYDSIEQAVGLELTQKIPEWVKNIFGWYAADQVSEDELLNAIKYLINEKILIVN